MHTFWSISRLLLNFDIVEVFVRYLYFTSLFWPLEMAKMARPLGWDRVFLQKSQKFTFSSQNSQCRSPREEDFWTVFPFHWEPFDIGISLSTIFWNVARLILVVLWRSPWHRSFPFQQYRLLIRKPGTRNNPMWKNYLTWWCLFHLKIQ